MVCVHAEIKMNEFIILKGLVKHGETYCFNKLFKNDNISEIDFLITCNILEDKGLIVQKTHENKKYAKMPWINITQEGRFYLLENNVCWAYNFGTHQKYAVYYVSSYEREILLATDDLNECKNFKTKQKDNKNYLVIVDNNCNIISRKKG